MEYSCYEVNVSSDSINETAWTYTSQTSLKQYRINGYLLASIMSLFLLLGTSFNLVVTAIIVKKRLYTQPTFILLLNLSVTDFFLCVLVMPFHVVTGFSGEFIFGGSDYVRCKVCKIAVIVPILISQSLYSVSLLSIDRFIFIKKPLHYHRIVTLKSVIPAIITTWLISITISVPPLFGIGQINYSQALFHCTLDIHEAKVYTLFLVAAALPPLTAIITSSLWVACIAQKHLRSVYKTQLSIIKNSEKQEFLQAIYKRAQRKKSKLQFHLVRVFGAIIVVNVITWMPMLSWICAAAAINKQDIPLFYKSMTYLFFLLQPLLHPALEASLISDIKQPLRQMFGSMLLYLKCRLCRQQGGGDGAGRAPAMMLPSVNGVEGVAPCDCSVVENGVAVGRMGGYWACSLCRVLNLCSVLVLPPADQQADKDIENA